MQNSSEIYLGIDLGGTNVRVGALTPGGELLCWQDAPIEAAQGPKKGLDKIAGLIESVSGQVARPVAAIGIGATGPIDHLRGVIQNPFTLPTWENVDIVSPLQKRFGVAVTLENDADAAALGESWMGVGRGLSRLVMVTVGTGIGTAFILDGKIYRGTLEMHPEGGHIPLDPAGPQCYCGARGCWESLASGPAIGAQARELAASQPSALLKMAGNFPENIDAALVASAARAGDALAIQIVERTANYLGLGLVSLLHVFLPDCVVLTGGVMRSYDLLEPRLRQVISQHSAMLPLDKIPLRMAELGQQAGIFGAARTAMPDVFPKI